MNSNIQDYIDLVRSGTIEVCKDQLLLCDRVERVFSTEDIYVDEEQLNKYLNQQKYFPFQLYEWERFCLVPLGLSSPLVEPGVNKKSLGK